MLRQRMTLTGVFCDFRFILECSYDTMQGLLVHLYKDILECTSYCNTITLTWKLLAVNTVTLPDFSHSFLIAFD